METNWVWGLLAVSLAVGCGADTVAADDISRDTANAGARDRTGNLATSAGSNANGRDPRVVTTNESAPFGSEAPKGVPPVAAAGGNGSGNGAAQTDTLGAQNPNDNRMGGELGSTGGKAGQGVSVTERASGGVQGAIPRTSPTNRTLANQAGAGTTPNSASAGGSEAHAPSSRGNSPNSIGGAPSSDEVNPQAGQGHGSGAGSAKPTTDHGNGSVAGASHVEDPSGRGSDATAGRRSTDSGRQGSLASAAGSVARGRGQ